MIDGKVFSVVFYNDYLYVLQIGCSVAAFEQIDLDVVNKRECAFRVENARLFPLETTEESLIARVRQNHIQSPLHLYTRFKAESDFYF